MQFTKQSSLSYHPTRVTECIALTRCRRQRCRFYCARLTRQIVLCGQTGGRYRVQPRRTQTHIYERWWQSTGSNAKENALCRKEHLVVFEWLQKVKAERWDQGKKRKGTKGAFVLCISLMSLASEVWLVVCLRQTDGIFSRFRPHQRCFWTCHFISECSLLPQMLSLWPKSFTSCSQKPNRMVQGTQLSCFRQSAKF